MNKNHYNLRLFQPLEYDLIKKTTLVENDQYSAMAITTRGLERVENQDYISLLDHPKDANLVMMAIADGISESKDGIAASQALVERFSDWFSLTSSMSFINNPMVLEGRILGELKRLNLELFKNGKNATSFALAIKGKHETLFANVGNCRGYTIKNDNIRLQTTDNLKWYCYNDPFSITPDEIKYLVGKDYLERNIGGFDNSEHYFHPFISIVDNNDYDSILLTTHGVTDFVDSKNLMNYINNNDIESALEMIIDESLYGEEKSAPKELIQRFKDDKKENMLVKRIKPGMSNTSVIGYKKH